MFTSHAFLSTYFACISLLYCLLSKLCLLFRLSYAQCLATLAETARKFLDIAHFQKQVRCAHTDAHSHTCIRAHTQAALKKAASAAGQTGDSKVMVCDVFVVLRVLCVWVFVFMFVSQCACVQVPYEGSYDQELATLQDHVLKMVCFVCVCVLCAFLSACVKPHLFACLQVVEMLETGGSKVKRSLLTDVTRCVSVCVRSCACV